MITNTNARDFDVIEVTNELPVNRLGGVGSVIEGLISGFKATGTRALWYLLDHNYDPSEVQRILSESPSVALGNIEELRQFRAPVAHLHTYNHNPELLNHLTVKKIVFTIHSLMRHEALSNNRDMHWGITQQERMIAGSDSIILVSNAELRHYRALEYDQLNPNVHVIHNGMAPPSASSSMPSNTKYIGFCGRLVPRKRPEYVQQLLREKGFEDHVTLIAGRGFSDYSRKLMSDPTLRQRVVYLGWCAGKRLEAFYDQIAVLAIPSVYEPFGMVAVEAMARGTPVVCTRIGGLLEVLGEAAVYADNHSYPAFHQAMRQWCDMSAEELTTMTLEARARYRENFTDIHMAHNYQRHFAAS